MIHYSPHWHHIAWARSVMLVLWTCWAQPEFRIAVWQVPTSSIWLEASESHIHHSAFSQLTGIIEDRVRVTVIHLVEQYTCRGRGDVNLKCPNWKFDSRCTTSTGPLVAFWNIPPFFAFVRPFLCAFWSAIFGKYTGRKTNSLWLAFYLLVPTGDHAGNRA